MKLVSVMMPCYNAELYIEAALDSLINQSYDFFELISVNDGSTDHTLEILNSWAKRDMRIKVYQNKENLGLSETRIKALKLCRGEYLAFLDSDDLWRKDKLELQVAFLDCNPEIDAVHSNSIVIDSNGIPTGATFRTLTEFGKKFQGNLFLNMVKGNYLNTTSMLLRRSSFEKTGGFPKEVKYNEDWLAWIRFSREFSFGYIDDCLSYYRVHQKNITKKINEYSDSRETIYNIILKEYAKELPIKIRSSIKYLKGCNLIELERFAEARLAFAASLRDWPFNWKAAVKYIISCIAMLPLP